MMARLKVAVLIFVTIAGCGRSSSPTNLAAGRAQSAAADRNEQNSVTREPVAFESIPLSSDSTYPSIPVGEGVEEGQIREMTALKIKFCWCPAGSFLMGSPNESRGHLINEAQYEAVFSKGFWIQQTELTQNQFEQLMGVNPAYFKGQDHPVESVTWTEATEFCRRLSALPAEKTAGNLFRLPTEAEWEYACRAGTTTEFYFGDDENEMEEYGWYRSNSERKTHPVAQKKPNSWGIYDMHGNVSEWCLDFYGDYPRESTTNPRGPLTGDKRNLRGGGWFFVPMFARSAHRDAYMETARYAGLGFRVVATTAADAGIENGNTGDKIP